MRENLLDGDPSATNRDLEQAVSLAELRGVISKLPRGLEEPLGPMDGKLSGGERKRVALARAFLQRPRILILDEVTSALDGPTAASLLEALDSFRYEKSVILISHRPSEVSWANRVMVLNRGKILDHGKHEDLMNRCELYRTLYDGLPLKSPNQAQIEALEF